MRIKEHKLKINLFELTALILLIIQVAFVVYTNLFRIPDTIDNDSAKLFLRAIEMWNKKSIFLNNWVNMTTLEIDCTALFAIPIYAVTNDIYIAFGAANIIFMGLYIYTFSGIMKKLGVNRFLRIITFILLLIPYSFGQLLYYNMMFFSGGQYIVKALIPALLIWILCNNIEENSFSFNWILMTILCSFLTFISSISSGMYIIMSAIIPIGLCYLWFDISKKKNLKKMILSKGAVYLAIEVFLSVVGIYIGIRKQVSVRGNNMYLISIKQLSASFANRISSLFELLGGLRVESYKVTSSEGITSLLRFAFTIVLLTAIFYYTIKIIKLIVNQKDLSLRELVISYILVVFWCGFIILLLTDITGTPRYNIMSVILAFPLVISGIHDIYNGIQNQNQKLLIMSCAFIIFIGVMFGSDYQVLCDDSDPEMKSQVLKTNQLLDFIHDYPEDHIFVLNDTGLSEVFRTLDYGSSKEYIGYVAATNSIEVYDYYYSDEYYTWLEDPFILIVCDSNSSIDELPDNMKERSEKLGHVHNYSLYYMN